MEKSDLVREEDLEGVPEINIGVVGHIDHGKTTLLKALTGKFTDTHSEELKRGITIKLGYADLIIYKHGDKISTKKESKEFVPVRYVSFIDTPGHEMLMATMLSGASIIDAALMVIAANEGIKPQTREYFMALQVKKINSLIVIQNKIDLVTKDQALKNYKEIKDFLKGTFAENSPIIPVSAQQGVNIERIVEEILKLDIPKRDLESDPFFLIARSFDVNKPGTLISDLRGGVLGGVLKRGKLEVGDEIEIKPGMSIKKPHGKVEYKTIFTKILSLRKGDKSVLKVTPGASISIETSLDPYLTRADSLKGCVVSLKNKLPTISYRLRIKTNLFREVYGAKELTKTEPIKEREVLMLSINTNITIGSVEKLSGDEANIILNIPVVTLKGDNIGIARNINGHWRLVGWGEVLEGYSE